MSGEPPQNVFRINADIAIPIRPVSPSIDEDDPPVPTPNPDAFECGVCYNMVPISWAVTPPCGHRACVVCADTHARITIEHRRFPLRCYRCSMNISPELIPSAALRHVYTSSYATYLKSINPDLRPCVMTNCEGYRHRTRDSDCDVCGVSYCIRCGERPVSGHYHLRSTPARKRKAESAPEFTARTVPCPTCGEGIERLSGCDNMTCSRCRTHFCWRCGKPGFGHPNGCT